jgi:polyvinyl alcohol dehydrogenase (cytochrome)
MRYRRHWSIIAGPVLIVVAAAALIFAMPPRDSTAAGPAGDWGTYLHDPSRTAANLDEAILSTSNAAQLHNIWSFATGDIVAASPTVAGNVVYVGSWDGYMYAINAVTGQQIWRSPSLGLTNVPVCPMPMGITSSATVQNGVVYVGGGGSNWYALSATTGAILWSVFVGDNTSGGNYNWSSPLIYNGYAYIGAASNCDTPLVQGRLLRVDLAAPHNVVGTFKVVPDGTLGGGIWGSPSIDPATNTIFVTTGNHNAFDPAPAPPNTRAILAIDATTMMPNGAWQVPAGQAVNDGDWGTTPTLFAGNLVAATNKNGYVYAFDRANLSAGPVWQRQIAIGGDTPEAGDGSVSSAAFDGTRLHVAGGNTTIGATSYPGSVRALDPATGAILWEKGVSGMVLAAQAYANGVVVDAAGATLEVRDTANGNLLYSYATGGQIFGAPTISNGRIVVGSTDGKIYAFGLPASVGGIAEAADVSALPPRPASSGGDLRTAAALGAFLLAIAAAGWRVRRKRAAKAGAGRAASP